MNNRRTGTSPKGRRPLRIAAEILRDLPGIIRRIVEVPEGALISITDVVVSDDLSHAKIFFSVVGEAEQQLGKQLEKTLNDHRPAIRHEIAQRLVMRQHPELHFIYDTTPARAARIEMLLNQARQLNPPAEGDA
jgi:ribosome-binding factor A